MSRIIYSVHSFIIVCVLIFRQVDAGTDADFAEKFEVVINVEDYKSGKLKVYHYTFMKFFKLLIVIIKCIVYFNSAEVRGD